MTRFPGRVSTQRFVSDEDRRTYHRWMQTFALVYGTLFCIAIGSAIVTSHKRAQEVSARAVTQPVPMIDLSALDW